MRTATSDDVASLVGLINAAYRVEDFFTHRTRMVAVTSLPKGIRRHLIREKQLMGKRRIVAEEARRVGASLGIDWTEVDPEQFRSGLEVELEHGARDPETNVTDDDLTLTGKIACAHLKEVPGLLHPAGQARSRSGRVLGVSRVNR